MSATLLDSLSRSYPAIPCSVPEARNEICQLAERAGASTEAVDSIRLGASEALTNVVLHAYRDDPGLISVTAAVVEEEMWLLISDDGCGLHAEANRPGLGLGFALIADVADHFTIGAPALGGVELQMRFDLVPAESRPRMDVLGAQSRGSPDSATRPASSRFSTTT
jgi:serine/threonine-protein kinase RsbW